MTLTYCGNIVRQQDSDRFLLSLLMPPKHRPALWALFAFNYEIARTREAVSDTTIGLIRLQWWRDRMAEIYEGKDILSHEVITPLACAIKDYDLPRELFDNLIYAREFDLEGVAPTNMEGLLNYCEYTNAPLVKLALKILGEEGNDTVVVDISKHYALIGVIRAVPYRLKNHQILLPQDILEKYHLSPEKLFNFKDKEELTKVVREVFEGGTPYRNIKLELSSPPFLKKMQHLVRLYEAQLETVDFDVFDPKLFTPPKFMALRLWAGL